MEDEVTRILREKLTEERNLYELTTKAYREEMNKIISSMKLKEKEQQNEINELQQ